MQAPAQGAERRTYTQVRAGTALTYGAGSITPRAMTPAARARPSDAGSPSAPRTPRTTLGPLEGSRVPRAVARTPMSGTFSLHLASAHLRVQR